MIRETEEGTVFRARINPNSGRFGISREDGRVRINVKSPPRKGKANAEIVKELGKLSGREAVILKGLKSRDKLILVRGMKKGKFEDIFLG